LTRKIDIKRNKATVKVIEKHKKIKSPNKIPVSILKVNINKIIGRGILLKAKVACWNDRP